MSHTSYNNIELSIGNVVYMVDLVKNIPIVLEFTIDELLDNNKVKISRIKDDKKIEHTLLSSNVHTNKIELLYEWCRRYKEFLYKIPQAISDTKLSLFYMLQQLQELGENIDNKEKEKYQPKIDGVEI